MPGHLERLAEAIAKSVADLLGTPVSVVDESGAVVASRVPTGAGVTPQGPEGAEFARVEVSLDGQRAQVVIGEPLTKEPVPARVAETLVSLLVKQKTRHLEIGAEREARNLLMGRLLLARVGSESSLIREGKSLGIDLTRPRSAILVDVGDYPPPGPGDVRRGNAIRLPQQVALVSGIVSRYFQGADDALYSRPTPGTMVVLKGSSRRDLLQWLEKDERTEGGEACSDLHAFERTATGLLGFLRSESEVPINVAFGRFYPGVRGLRRSYSEASLALKVGRHFAGPDQVFSLHRLGLRAFAELSDAAARSAVADQLLGPIEHDEELVNTLRVFFEENCSLSTSAYRLSLHRNTLTYRLDKIERVTGLDPRRLDDAVQMRTAIVLRDSIEQRLAGGYRQSGTGGHTATSPRLAERRLRIDRMPHRGSEREPAMTLRAVIFDMDGLMIDSESVQLRAMNATLRPLGVEISLPEWTGMVGKRGVENLRHIKEKYGLAESVEELVAVKNRIYGEMLRQHVPAMPGLQEAISACLRARLRLAVASSSILADIRVVVDALGLAGVFEALVSGDEVVHGKPNPDIFTLAAQRLAVPPVECLVLEDTAYGVAAAKDAGMFCIALPNEFTAHQDFSRADLVLSSLAGLDDSVISSFSER